MATFTRVTVSVTTGPNPFGDASGSTGDRRYDFAKLLGAEVVSGNGCPLGVQQTFEHGVQNVDEIADRLETIIKGIMRQAVDLDSAARENIAAMKE